MNGERVWRIPDTKNGRDFLVPLQGPIAEILLRRSMEVGGKGPLFWKYNAERDYPDQLKKANRNFRELSELEDVRPHDWRRTGRTHVSSLGVREEVAEAAMNHCKDDLKQVYNLHEFWPERKEALRLWHEKLERLRCNGCVRVVANFKGGYHWSLMQLEYATDIIFRSAADLKPLSIAWDLVQDLTEETADSYHVYPLRFVLADTAQDT
jgi:hypothetical protein